MKKNQTSKEKRVRINRFLSQCGISSRRKSEELVVSGRVSVNGQVITNLSTTVDPDRDKVFLDEKQVVRLVEHVYMVMNKPKDTISTSADERGRKTVLSLIPSRHRVFPIGRLDRNTTGVLLFTNDGDFANRLMHPRFGIPKSYRVTCEVQVQREHLRQIGEGVMLDDGMTGKADVYVIPGGRGKEIGITIREGRNRQIHRMFSTLGYEVTKLDRVAYGPVTKEGLKRGEVRLLTRSEVRKLNELAGFDDSVE